MHHSKIKLPLLALAALFLAGLPLPSSAQVSVTVSIAPPAIPVIVQPFCPTPGYIWAPGYWAYDEGDYFWVPGGWVAPPRIGYLWTPGYWGFRGGSYIFNEGYWGPTVGFYGGINYGAGYIGRGYCGGQWVGNTFSYNTAVTRVNTTVIQNTYVNNEVVNNYHGSTAGFNGPNGAQATPTPAEQAAATAEHVPPTAFQHSLAQTAKTNPALRATANHGNPNPNTVAAVNHVAAVRAHVTPAPLPKNEALTPAETAKAHTAKAEPGTPPVKATPTETAKPRTAQVESGTPPPVKPAKTVHPKATPNSASTEVTKTPKTNEMAVEKKAAPTHPKVEEHKYVPPPQAVRPPPHPHTPVPAPPGKKKKNPNEDTHS